MAELLLPTNVADLGKLFVAKGFKKLPKVHKIAKSGHTASFLRKHEQVTLECFEPNHLKSIKIKSAM